jgi:ABC-type Mn2+/Zn2+ transport system permease subunit
MNYYLLILRILHIGAGVYWVGSTLLYAVVIAPALRETKGSGQKFIDYLITKKRFGTESAGAGSMAGIAGILLYWRDSQGLTSAWMHSGAGIGFTAGAVLGLIAFIFGVLTDRQLKALAELREKFGDAPSVEQTSQLQSLDKQLSTNLYICAGALTLSVWVMAVSRYLVF